MGKNEIKKNLFTLDLQNLVIKFVFENELVEIATVKWDSEQKYCYFETFGSNFQDYVTSWERFIDVVYLLDEAYVILHERKMR